MEENMNQNQENKNKEKNVKKKSKKAKIAVISICTVCVILLGMQIYASASGHGNLFMMIRDWTTTKSATGKDEILKDRDTNTSINTNISTNTNTNTNVNTNTIAQTEKKSEIKYEINKKNDGAVIIKATKNGKTVSKELKMTATIDETGTMKIPGIGEVALVAETGGEYYGVNVIQLVGDEIKKIGLINCGADMVKDATYTVKTKGEGTVIIDAKTNKETITKEIEMTAAIDKTEVADVLKCGKVVFVSETGGEYYAVKVFRASQDYTNGKLKEIKEVGTIQNNIDYVQLEPDNYAEEIAKGEIEEKVLAYIEKNQKNGTAEKLLDYKVEEVQVLSESDKMNLVNQYPEEYKATDYLAIVYYSVKPQDINNTGWMAANGTIEGEWIKNKMTCVTFRDGDILGMGATSF